MALAVCTPARAEVAVYAPGALAPVIEEMAQDSGLAVKVVSGHSPAQARQITEGAGADIFISADPQWMEFLQGQGLLEPHTTVILAETRLVLLTAATSTLTYHALPGESLAALLGGGRLAIGDPDILPAGRFARDALIRLGAWADVQDHLAMMQHVGMIATMIERGEVPAGIAFAADAGTDPKLRIAA